MRVNLSEKGGNRVIRIEIRPEEAGRRVLRFLEIILPGAPKSFLFKALRQNKFKINGRHARDEKAVLKAGDVVECYLTDEQLSDFGYGKAREEKSPQKKLLLPGKIRIVYEDKDLLVVDKPAGIATQKSSRDDISLTEIMRDRILSENREQSSYHPSFCHRLDKNTSGLLIMAKTLEAHQAVPRMLEERLVRKYYLAIVCGTSTAWEQETRLIHRYEKVVCGNAEVHRDPAVIDRYLYHAQLLCAAVGNLLKVRASDRLRGQAPARLSHRYLRCRDGRIAWLFRRRYRTSQ